MAASPWAAGPHWDDGKYAGFVLAAYALSALVILAMIVQTLVEAWRWRRAAMRDAGRRAATGPARASARTRGRPADAS